MKAIEKKVDSYIPSITPYCSSHQVEIVDLSGEGKTEGPSGTVEGRDTIKPLEA